MKVDQVAVFRTDMSAIEQLELWLTYQKHWCEHKPSVTISVKEDEWLEVGAWVYKILTICLVSVSFHLQTIHINKHHIKICKKKSTNFFLDKMPKEVDWTKLSEYEKTDMTIGAQELACAAGFCEIQ